MGEKLESRTVWDMGWIRPVELIPDDVALIDTARGCDWLEVAEVLTLDSGQRARWVAEFGPEFGPGFDPDEVENKLADGFWVYVRVFDPAQSERDGHVVCKIYPLLAHVPVRVYVPVGKTGRPSGETERTVTT